MPARKQTGSLQISEDIEYQQRMWRIQRIGWVIFALIILAALAGLFGRGPLSAAAVEAGPVTLRYERFARLLAPLILEIELPPPAADQQQTGFWLSSEYLESLNIQHISPEPNQEQFSGEGHIFSFDVDRPGEPLRVTINAKPDRMGLHRGAVGSDGDSATPFSQFVYP